MLRLRRDGPQLVTSSSVVIRRRAAGGSGRSNTRWHRNTAVQQHLLAWHPADRARSMQGGLMGLPRSLHRPVPPEVVLQPLCSLSHNGVCTDGYRLMALSRAHNNSGEVERPKVDAHQRSEAPGGHGSQHPVRP